MGLHCGDGCTYLKTTEVYTLKGQILWYVNYINKNTNKTKIIHSTFVYGRAFSCNCFRTFFKDIYLTNKGHETRGMLSFKFVLINWLKIKT